MIYFELHLEKWHNKTPKPLWFRGFSNRYLFRFAMLVAEAGLVCVAAREWAKTMVSPGPLPGEQHSPGLEGDLSRMIFTKGKKQGLPHKIMCDKPCFDWFAIHNGGHIPSSGLYDYFPKQDSVVT